MLHSLERNLLALFQHLFSVNASHLMPQHLCSSRSPLSCDTFDSIDISYLNSLRAMLLLGRTTQEFSANWLTFNHYRCHTLLLLTLCPTTGHFLMTFTALTFYKWFGVFCLVWFFFNIGSQMLEMSYSRAELLLVCSELCTLSACWPDSAHVGFCSIICFNEALLFYTDKELVPH